ncbi:MAG: hypothetical protein KJO79_05690 [Verrucomicrobiae bacterium]|nr:hypothetical protein [Verrucomicrobiae bacterium]NNJ86654.1 hypothetical protein [Akkermansiaceae bacterium]
MDIKASQLRRTKYAPLCALLLLGLITSCDQKGDPSYEKQSLKLAAEKATIEANLKATEDKLKSAEATISSLRNQIAMLKVKPPQPLSTEPKFDKEKIQLGFMRGIDALKARIEREQTQHTVESVTFEKMDIPTDKPFSSGVTIKLKSKQTGKLTQFRWQGHGSLKGEWDFEPLGEVATNSADVAANNSQKKVADNAENKASEDSGKRSSNGSGVRVIREGTNERGEQVNRIVWPEDNPRNTGQPTPPQPNPQAQPTTPERPKAQPPKQPVQPKKPTRPRQPADPNTHKIDWGKLKK